MAYHKDWSIGINWSGEGIRVYYGDLYNQQGVLIFNSNEIWIRVYDVDYEYYVDMNIYIYTRTFGD